MRISINDWMFPNASLDIHLRTKYFSSFFRQLLLHLKLKPGVIRWTCKSFVGKTLDKRFWHLQLWSIFKRFQWQENICDEQEISAWNQARLDAYNLLQWMNEIWFSHKKLAFNHLENNVSLHRARVPQTGIVETFLPAIFCDYCSVYVYHSLKQECVLKSRRSQNNEFAKFCFQTHDKVRAMIVNKG